MPPRWLREYESKHLSERQDELFLHVASVCAAPCVCSLTNMHWQQSPSDKSLFSGCLRLSTYYGSWQFRTKLFTVKRNLPQACSCVNGEKMTGRLTAKRCGAAARCGKKKKKTPPKWSSSFSVLINLQRQECDNSVLPWSAPLRLHVLDVHIWLRMLREPTLALTRNIW